jgi:hypothetical protein
VRDAVCERQRETGHRGGDAGSDENRHGGHSDGYGGQEVEAGRKPTVYGPAACQWADTQEAPDRLTKTRQRPAYLCPRAASCVGAQSYLAGCQQASR